MTVEDENWDQQPDPANPYEAEAYGAEGLEDDYDPDAPDPADPESGVFELNHVSFAGTLTLTEDSPENYDWFDDEAEELLIETFEDA
eukprot:6158448-Karenia_brevis.AAC.1